MPVGSLYRRAQTFLTEFDARRAALKLVRKDDTEDDREISAEDRTKIMGQIDGVVARSRIAITPDTFRVVPKLRGWLFPTVVNLVAVVVVTGGIVLAVELGRRTERSIIAAPSALATAEGKLLEAFKEESRQELEGKDREIADIRERLAGIDQEKERIRLAAEQSVLTREQELRQEFGRSLEAERARLAASGLAEQDIVSRIAVLEQANSQELETALEAARAEAQAEREEQERTVERLRAEYEQTLSAAQGERSRLAEEAERRQAELEAGSRARQLALEQEKGQALDELARLRRQQENEQLVLDQFLSFYRRARDAIQSRDTATARTVLSELRKYMDEPTVAALPGVSRRRQVELFLIGSLEETLGRIESEAQSLETTLSLVASANLVTAVAELVRQGDALFSQQDYARARDLYLLAMSRIPALQAGRTRLEEIERLFAAQERADLGAIISAANEAYRGGEYNRALASYSEALLRMQGERGTVDTLVAQLREIGARAREAELTPRIRALEGEVAAGGEALRGLESRLAARSVELEQARTALEESRATTRVAELESLRSELARTQATVGDLERELEVRTAQLEDIRGELAARLTQLDTARSELTTSLADLGVVGARLARNEEEGRALRERVDVIAGRLDRVTSTRTSAAETTPASTEPSTDRGQLLALLQTKLQVQRVLLSAPVLREYPDLYEGNERYVQALVTERSGRARLEALEDLDRVLARLTGAQDAATIPNDDIKAFTVAEESALLQRILERLESLLE